MQTLLGRPKSVTRICLSSRLI